MPVLDAQSRLVTGFQFGDATVDAWELAGAAHLRRAVIDRAQAACPH